MDSALRKGEHQNPWASLLAGPGVIASKC